MTVRFPIDLPAPTAGVLDRSEDVREPARILAGWAAARMLPLGPDGTVPTRTDGGGVSLVFAPATDWGDEPAPGATLLGSFEGVDYWATPEPAPRPGPEELSYASMRTIGPLLSDTDTALAMAAVALNGWHTATGFCSRCGQRTAPDLSGHSRTCAEGHLEFPRTDPAVIVLVHDDAGRAVLARQPFWAPGRFSVLAGFAEAGESLEATVAREIGEEIGIDVGEVEYLGSQPWPFPRSLMIAFAARAREGATLRPRPGEIADARWFSRAELRELIAQPEPVSSAFPAGGPADVPGAITLPGRLSIARRMIEGFVRAE